MKCLKCKKKIDEDDVYCGYCGIHQEKYQIYLNRVINKVHKDQDKDYRNAIKRVENKIKKLQNNKIWEINRIAKSRWKSVGIKTFQYNLTEGKVTINGTTYLFSDIKGAEIITQDSYRVITTENSKSKKHASLGGGLLGAAVAGPVGAVVGGSVLGKTKTKGQSVSNSIPTCNHIGVNVNIKGFNTEIVLLSNTVDQSSVQYNNAQRNAQMILDKLRILANTDVPKSFLKPEEEQSVINIENEIIDANKELEEVKNDKPTYEIPEKYL